MRLRSVTVVGSSVIAAGALVAAAVGPMAQAAPSSTGVQNMNTRVCATPALGQAACDAILHVGPAKPGNGHKPGSTTPPAPVSYGAAQLQAAYGLTTFSTGTGTGATVAVVDAYDDPNAFTDLTTYRTTETLKPIGQCTVTSTSTKPTFPSSTVPCFAKVNQTGVSGTYPRRNKSWAEEISLDLDMVSAICPNCNILLVEANSSYLTTLGPAVNTAASFTPVAIGNSYGGTEFGTEATFATDYYTHAGIAITAASGDNGYGVEFPAAASSVVAVGGTTLVENSTVWSQAVWSGTGSGCSAYIAKPTWQTPPAIPDAGCTANRIVTDVAADANPNTGVDVYDSYGQHGSGWLVFGGTSVATEIITGVYGLADNHVSTAAGLYTAGSTLYDVTTGSNGSCTGHGRFQTTTLAYLCTAGTGYDGPTGMGTPNGHLTGF